MSVDTNGGVTETPNGNGTTQIARKFGKGFLAISIVGSVIALVLIVAVAAFLLGANSNQTTGQLPTPPVSGEAGGKVAPQPTTANLGQPRLLEPQSKDETHNVESIAVTEKMVNRLATVLGNAYQSRDPNWLRYYYASPGNLTVGKTDQWHRGITDPSWPGVEGYTGPGKVTVSNITPYEFLDDYVLVRYTIDIDGTQYQTQQKIVWSYVNGSGADYAWLVTEESTLS